MIPIDEVKRLLGPLAEGRSDAEIEKMREDLYSWADIIIEYWLRTKNAEK